MSIYSNYVVAGLREAVKRRGPDHESAEILSEYVAWSENFPREVTR
ncbi:hypothetical protein KNN17_20915 [Arthrobacter bambusae]|nr:hypothetical protein [Arthrobacter bambusae]MCI0144026.1 hypothetical protein [Arthrobacter bambusae]